MQTRTTKEIPMDIQDAMATQLAAAERLERAQAELSGAQRWAATVAPDAPLRIKVRDVERIRRAESELAEAQAASDAAQDLPCPEI